MIPLAKLDEPRSLKKNKVRWTNELLAAIKTGDEKQINSKKKKYNQPDVKDQLKRETNEKCAYCESRITVVAHGDIEHITPKALEPRHTFEWENLTFACQICNQHKSNKEDISDPYSDSMEEFVFLLAPVLVGSSAKTRRTVIELDLNRPALIENRTAHIVELSRALEAIHKETDVELKNLMFSGLERDVGRGKSEYVAMKATLLRDYKQLWAYPWRA